MTRHRAEPRIAISAGRSIILGPSLCSRCHRQTRSGAPLTRLCRISPLHSYPAMSLMLSALHQPATAACAMQAARAAFAIGTRHASTLSRRPAAASALRSVTSTRSALSVASAAPSRGFLTVIPQATVGYRQFLGGGRTRLNPGLHLNLPILHEITAVDMREGRIDMENLSAVSKDNIMVWITGTLFYQGQMAAAQ